MASKFGPNTKKYFPMQSVADLWNLQLWEALESNAVGGFRQGLVWQTAACPRNANCAVKITDWLGIHCGGKGKESLGQQAQWG